MSVFGDNIAMLRAKFGISQRDLADALGISKGTVGAWETKGTLPDLERLNDVAKYFNVTQANLFTPEFLHAKDAIYTSSELKVVEEFNGGNPKNLRGSFGFPCPDYLINRHKHAYYVSASRTSDKAIPIKAFVLIDPMLAEPIIDGKLYLVQRYLNYEVSVDIYRVASLSNGLMIYPDSTDQNLKPFMYDYSESSRNSVTVFGKAVWYTIPFDTEL